MIKEPYHTEYVLWFKNNSSDISHKMIWLILEYTLTIIGDILAHTRNKQNWNDCMWPVWDSIPTKRYVSESISIWPKRALSERCSPSTHTVILYIYIYFFLYHPLFMNFLPRFKNVHRDHTVGWTFLGRTFFSIFLGTQFPKRLFKNVHRDYTVEGTFLNTPFSLSTRVQIFPNDNLGVFI